MTIAEGILRWQASERDYYEGLAIYSRAASETTLPATRGLLSKLNSGPISWNIAKLDYELDKVLQACPEPYSELIEVSLQASAAGKHLGEQFVANVRNAAAAIAYADQPADTDPPEIVQAREIRQKSYRIRDRLHADLCNTPANYHSEAYERQLQILDHQQIIDDRWAIIDHFQRTGQLPASQNIVARLASRYRNVLTYISKRRKSLLKSPTGDKAHHIKVQLIELSAERDKLKAQLGYE